MTDFRELANLLARGRNFKENAMILGVAENDGENLNITIHYDGDNNNMRSVLMSIIDNYLSVFDDETARYERDALLTVFVEDEERRLGVRE